MPWLGIDLGGTKVEGVILDDRNRELARHRVPTPAGDYNATLAAIANLIDRLESESGCSGLPLGIGTPGSISPSGDRLRNANSTCLNGRPLRDDLSERLGRPVRISNDANCLAISEWHDGAAADYDSVFAVILGTGVGGGLVIGGQLQEGRNRVGGEWGHNPLPWAGARAGEGFGSECWCGRRGCIETWLSGPAISDDHLRYTGQELDAVSIAAEASDGNAAALATLDRFHDRLARALASVINIVDPDIIVVGGGLSAIDSIYEQLPLHWARWVFSDVVTTPVVPAVHGDASGVRGAAWLWREGLQAE